MKERFYNAVNELNLANDPNAEVLCYDAEHEKRRKEQLIKQWNRTPQEIEEEEMLIAEMKKIEVRKRERERKAQDLQKLITASDRTPSTPANTSSALSPAPGIKKKSAVRPKISSASMAHSASTSFIAEHSSLRFPEFRSAGAHLRSQEMKLPTNVGQKKLKNIETVIEKLKLDLVPVGAEEIVVGYNEFRSSIVLLQELKHALQTAEYELESIRTRYNSLSGKTFEIEPRMRISSTNEMPVFGEEKEGTTAGLPSSSRTITEMIELSSSLPQAKAMDEVGSSSDEDYVPSEHGNESEGDEEQNDDSDVGEHDLSLSSSKKPRNDERTVSEEKEESEKERQRRLDALFDDFIGGSSSSMGDSHADEPTTSSATINAEVKKQGEAVDTCGEKSATETKTVTEIFDFAGEEVREEVNATRFYVAFVVIRNLCAVSTVTCKRVLRIERTIPKPGDDVFTPPKTNASKHKISSGGLGDAVKLLSKKPKMSVLDKTQHDWTVFKSEHGIHDELRSHNRGRDGYVEKMAFLRRADFRQFDREREARNANRSKK
ncbi:unnamed protein product [Toxocara canis]|uniref:BCNT-C domain-containing protein n=1 Tax=Toxocara canis TaxID=6265 RepID=A0A183URR9_TOXCA|nr:unnamed protein product [Toxocara canis]